MRLAFLSRLATPFTWGFVLVAATFATGGAFALSEDSRPLLQVDRVLELADEVSREVDELERKAADFIRQATETIQAAIQQSAASRETPIPAAVPREISSTPASATRPVVYILPIEGQVRPIMMTLFQRGLRDAEEKDVDLVLLVMDTPGGELAIAEEISRNLLECKVPTATWIKNEGLSAGMLIAISTQKIFMRSLALIGDCQPIFAGAGEIKEAPEKVLTVVRAYGERAAKQNGYPVDAVLAMIDENRDYTSPDGEIRAATGQILTLRAEDAVKIQFASAICESTDEVLVEMGLENAVIKRFEKNWAESLAAFIASPAVASLLALIGLAGLFIEYKTPGFGFPGGVGLVALALVFWGHSIAHLAGLEGLVLFMVGAVLLAVEIFLIPGFGFFGLAGLGLMSLGLLISFLTVPFDSPFFVPEIHLGLPLTQLTIALFGAVVLIFIAAAYMPSVPVLNRWGITLAAELQTQKGFSSHDQTPRDEWMGKAGVALSTLKPGGLVNFAGRRVDVVSEGDYIDPGEKVRVVDVRGTQIVVRRENPHP